MKQIATAAMTGTALLMGLLSAQDASAMWRTIHGINCKVSGAGSPTYDPGSGQVVNATAADIVLICPVESDVILGSAYPGLKGTVHGYANGVAATVPVGATPCVTWWDGGGGRCEAVVSQGSGPGVVSVPVFPNTWAQSSSYDYAFLKVQLGRMSGASANVLFGAYLETP